MTLRFIYRAKKKGIISRCNKILTHKATVLKEVLDVSSCGRSFRPSLSIDDKEREVLPLSSFLCGCKRSLLSFSVLTCHKQNHCHKKKLLFSLLEVTITIVSC